MAKLFIAALLAAALAPSAAVADDFYAGATLSKGGSLTYRNPANGKADTADAQSTYKLYGGYAFTNYLALEGGYIHTGATHHDKAALGLANDPTFKRHGLYAALRPQYQFNDAWSVFGKAGLVRNTFKTTDGAGRADSVSSVKPLLGVGVAYHVTRAAALTLEYEHGGRTRKPGLDIKQNSLQLGVKFGF
jgi:OOP family OmpA-OmpF porin